MIQLNNGIIGRPFCRRPNRADKSTPVVRLEVPGVLHEYGSAVSLDWLTVGIVVVGLDRVCSMR
jgi:hypothetical protein